MIKFILCTDKNGAIGYKNQLLYHISDDLKRFKELTKNQIVLMGRKTLESLPNQFLPHRINVVITRDKNYKPKNSSVIVMHDFDTIINHYQSGEQDKDLIVIGGAQIYEEFPRYPDVIYHTQVLDTNTKHDAEIDMEELLGTSYHTSSVHPKYVNYKTETHFDEKSGLFYQFTDYVQTSYLAEYHNTENQKKSLSN